ncbi:hypothetical protein F5Y05DRAFT_420576 [Hypoxylon sp. FL0543]|nr:hypothetical protein F5Y05DRAFT_420576 [Hypoxylon sp. FL0543]
MKELSDRLIWGIIVLVIYEALIAMQAFFWTRDLLRGRWFRGFRLPEKRVYRAICAPFIWLSACIAISILVPLFVVQQIAMGLAILVLWLTDEVKGHRDRGFDLGLPAGIINPRKPRRNRWWRGSENSARRGQNAATNSAISSQLPHGQRGRTMGNASSPEPLPPAYIP